MANVLDVIGGGISGLAKDAASGIFSGIAEVIGKFKADPNISAQSAAKIAELEMAIQKAQLDAEVALSQAQTRVNEVEAASSDKFTSRWRPYVGWICGTGMAVALLVAPLFTWASAWATTGHPGPFPTLDTNLLTTTLFAMLGIGAQRSFDKMKGTSK